MAPEFNEVVMILVEGTTSWPSDTRDKNQVRGGDLLGSGFEHGPNLLAPLSVLAGVP